MKNKTKYKPAQIMGALGRSKNTPAQANASRANGRLGGRPRKLPITAEAALAILKLSKTRK